MADLHLDPVLWRMGEQYICAPGQDFVKIETPYLLPDGTVVELFLEEAEEGWLLTDFGDTTGWLWTVIAEHKQLDEREAYIEDMCEGLHVEYSHGNLITRFKDLEELADAITRLSQAIIRVSCLWYTFREARYQMQFKANQKTLRPWG